MRSARRLEPRAREPRQVLSDNIGFTTRPCVMSACFRHGPHARPRRNHLRTRSIIPLAPSFRAPVSIILAMVSLMRAAVAW